LSFLVLSCAGLKPPEKVEPGVPAPARPLTKPQSDLSVDEQQKRSLDAFSRVLDVSEQPDRAVALDQKTQLYYEIIDLYPDAPLAQESYWRLVEVYLREYDPPRKAEAEAMFKELKARYPQSPMLGPIEGSIARFYHTYGFWNDLLALEKPYVEEYVRTGQLSSPTALFLYSEAKMNLKDLKEAYKGFKIVVSLFPDSSEARVAKERLERIQSIVDSQEGL
ncbi:MAG: tetratricopeptide repeat protein, partial [Thermodesulfovibrionales bacterium]